MTNNPNNKIDYNRWESWSWKSDGRYYHLSLSQTLFGEWVVTRKWGGLHTNIHGAKKHYCNPSISPTYAPETSSSSQANEEDWQLGLITGFTVGTTVLLAASYCI